jgi:hypothetical protein
MRVALDFIVAHPTCATVPAADRLVLRHDRLIADLDIPERRRLRWLEIAYRHLPGGVFRFGWRAALPSGDSHSRDFESRANGCAFQAATEEKRISGSSSRRTLL